MSLLAIAPALMAVLVLAFFPETARRELEDINPEDDIAPPADAPPPGSPERPTATPTGADQVGSTAPG